jgi:predicted RNase H-like HicB family nuclease
MTRLRLPSILIALTLALGGCTSMPEEDTLPEREFDNHEVYPLMEQLVADAVAVLPDFPGFSERRGTLQSCTNERGDAIEGWVSIELKYAFDEPISQTEQVREQYTDVLREAWTEAGYEITWDEASPTGEDYNLEAARSDGITLWWRVWGRTSLTIQSGCVPIGDGEEKPDYIPPAGGVLPENDPFGNYLDPSVYADETSTDTETDEAAVDPFDDTMAAEGTSHGTSPFTHEL